MNFYKIRKLFISDWADPTVGRKNGVSPSKKCRVIVLRTHANYVLNIGVDTNIFQNKNNFD